MQKKYYFLVLILSLLAIIAYDAKPTNEELSTYFTENKDTFLNLSKTTCLAQEQHKIVFHVYRHNEEDRIEHPEMKDYPELDNQLKSTINGKFLQDIAIFGEPCRLYVSVWDGGMVLGGESIAYEYNPKNIQPYDPNVDLDKMKKEFKNIYYTIELSDGWFVSYQYWP